jgi:hypothetical protein
LHYSWLAALAAKCTLRPSALGAATKNRQAPPNSRKLHRLRPQTPILPRISLLRNPANRVCASSFDAIGNSPALRHAPFERTKALTGSLSSPRWETLLRDWADVLDEKNPHCSSCCPCSTHGLGSLDNARSRSCRRRGTPARRNGRICQPAGSPAHRLALAENDSRQNRRRAGNESLP